MLCKCGCGKECVSSGAKPKLFYSDACRMRSKRTAFNEVNELTANEQQQTNMAHARMENACSVIIPDSMTLNHKPTNYGLPNCQCWYCKQNRIHDKPLLINHGPYKTASELEPGEVNRVSLPGDCDYDGCCVQVDGRWAVPESCTITATV